MASFFSFVYRRQSNSPARFDSHRQSSNSNSRATRVSTVLGSREHDIRLPHNDETQQQRLCHLFLPPGVTSSGSTGSDDTANTTAWENHPQLSSQGDEDENLHHTVHHQNNASSFTTKTTSPFTPEGLLPRKSADSLRRELDLPPRGLDFSLPLRYTNNSITTKQQQEELAPTKEAEKIRTRLHLYQQIDEDDDNNMILPPPDFPSTTSQPSFMESSVKSPVVSTSSFYSRRSSSQGSRNTGGGKERPVAMSPVLHVGQARTAVGAIVALREAGNNHNAAQHPTTPSLLVPYPPLPSEKDIGKEQPQKQQDLSFSMSVLPPRGPLQANNDYDDEEDVKSHASSEEENNIPYHLPAVVLHQSVAMPSRAAARSRHDLPYDRNDDDSCLHASPSSIVQTQRFQGRFHDRTRAVEEPRVGLLTGAKDNKKQQQQQQDNQLAVPRIALSGALVAVNNERAKKAPQERTRQEMPLSLLLDSPKSMKYDLDEEEDDLDVALMRRKFQNQQQRKQQRALQHQDIDDDFCYYDDGLPDHYESDESDDDEEEEDFEDEQVDYFHDSQMISDEAFIPAGEWENELLRRKTINQRLEKEKLLLEVTARLRDNVDLVNDVGTAASSSMAAMGSWFIKTPLDSENLLTGFSTEQRSKLICGIDSILHELDLAQPEEFFLSPSKIPSMATTHDTLHQALMFCRAMLLSAVPRSEKEKMLKKLPSINDNCQLGNEVCIWRCLPELRSAMGIVPPLSPETVRGGGTSLFSLPDESAAETPHTSNVSVATSITSVNTHLTRLQTKQMKPQLILRQDGLQLRHTVEVVSSLLQRLTLSCLQLGDLLLDKAEKGPGAKGFVQAADEIKKIYLELVAIQKEDSRALAAAFHLELFSSSSSASQNGARSTTSLAREVSTDEDDLNHLQLQAKRQVHKGQVLALASALGHSSSFQEQGLNNHGPLSSDDDIFVTPEDTEDSGRPENLFSPCTEDMRSRTGCHSLSHNQVPYEYDDLRRQVGSYDREDNDDREERDGPDDEDDFAGREDSEELRRMYQNVSLAASSIRSSKLIAKGRPLD